MRFEDISNYWQLKKIADNPLEIVKFRWHGKKTNGASLTIDFKTEPPLYIRGGYDDFHIFHRIFLRDEYRLKTLVNRKLDCVVDLGANVGLFSALAASFARNVYAYEPCPYNFDSIKKNLSARTNVTFVPEAVAAKAGTINLYLPHNEGRSGSYSSFKGSTVLKDDAFCQVPAISLADLFERHDINHCNLLKLDVEGQEYDILYAISDEIYRKIERIHAEYHHTWTDDDSKTMTALATFLKKKGFTVDIEAKKNKNNQGMFFARK